MTGMLMYSKTMIMPFTKLLCVLLSATSCIGATIFESSLDDASPKSCAKLGHKSLEGDDVSAIEDAFVVAAGPDKIIQLKSDELPKFAKELVTHTSFFTDETKTQEMIEATDKDGSGEIERNELRSLKTAVHIFKLDTGGDRKISLGEMRGYHFPRYDATSVLETANVYAMVDLNEDGELDPQEIIYYTNCESWAYDLDNDCAEYPGLDYGKMTNADKLFVKRETKLSPTSFAGADLDGGSELDVVEFFPICHFRTQFYEKSGEDLP
uniref:EF-hand domain-containing protein n=1 Tax=Lotharella oceanica TaxID=641309 RepID=A0A7S2XH70_9EUKA|mmetsp:Transcript_8783/g.17215  ORF Transcript_8783/g.17215 Transcript_8783/m.17215 type:complete len:267 (+) Transcript_8783:40-840(+)